jgi:site-specific recombinase XerD
LRHFYRYLIDEGAIKKDPTRYLPMPGTWKKLPKGLSEGDLERMIDSLGTSLHDIRDRTLLLTFFASGLRESELAMLKVILIWKQARPKFGTAKAEKMVSFR